MITKIHRISAGWGQFRQEGEAKQWGTRTPVVSVQIRAFRPTPNVDQIWYMQMTKVRVVDGQKIFDSLLIP